MRYLAILFVIVLMPASVSQATIGAQLVPVNCPLDGHRLAWTIGIIELPEGTMLDQQPYAAALNQQSYAATKRWSLKEEIPQCPNDGMFLYRADFTPEEVAVLKNYVASSEYQKMLHEETAYWMIAKLQEKLGAPLSHRWHTLLQATWQAPTEKYESYARETIRAIEAFLADPKMKEVKGFETAQLLLGELHRRIGDFDNAKKIFEKLMATPEFKGDEFYMSLIKYQLELIAAQDKASHKIPDFHRN